MDYRKSRAESLLLEKKRDEDEQLQLVNKKIEEELKAEAARRREEREEREQRQQFKMLQMQLQMSLSQQMFGGNQIRGPAVVAANKNPDQIIFIQEVKAGSSSPATQVAVERSCSVKEAIRHLKECLGVEEDIVGMYMMKNPMTRQCIVKLSDITDSEVTIEIYKRGANNKYYFLLKSDM